MKCRSANSLDALKYLPVYSAELSREKTGVLSAACAPDSRNETASLNFLRNAPFLQFHPIRKRSCKESRAR